MPEDETTAVSIPIFVCEYAVKFVCGQSGGSCGDPVAKGHYDTAINVHNATTHRVGFHRRVAVAKPGLEAGPVSTFSPARLGPDEALEIDCADIRWLRAADVRTLLGRHVPQARQMLRKLLAGPTRVSPYREGDRKGLRFEGQLVFDCVLASSGLGLPGVGSLRAGIAHAEEFIGMPFHGVALAA